jgi:chemotaxis protein methyltransferase CheR
MGVDMGVTVSSETFVESATLNKLKKMLHDATNINFEYYRESYLKRRLNVRLVATKTKTYADYMRYLKSNPDEYDLLVNDLTINYTKFFRDADVYSFLKQTILPELMSSKRLVKIWSAGCATGEEPYSLAILANEVLKKQTDDCRVTIYASDLDKSALAKAESGKYDSRIVQGIEKSILDKYFDFDNGSYRVKNFVKQLIQFEIHDLMTTPRRQNLDLILCRNVTIYFSKEIQQEIYVHFFNSLRTGGYLVTGKTEFVGGDVSRIFADVNAKCRVYRKPDQTS